MSDIVRRQIPERRVDGKPLGRHVHHDPRSLDYPAETATRITSVTHHAYGLPLSQTRGSCTAEALCGARNSIPNHHKGDRVYVQKDADALYDDEIRLEGGNPATDDPGGTGLLVCKAAKLAGLITSYQHAFGLEHMLQALVVRPVIIGINWYDSMDSPAHTGEVKVTPGAEIRGGHEIAARGIDAPSKMVWFWQSWGDYFGWGGRFCMSYSTVERLLGEQGDCTVPVR